MPSDGKDTWSGNNPARKFFRCPHPVLTWEMTNISLGGVSTLGLLVGVLTSLFPSLLSLIYLCSLTSSSVLPSPLCPIFVAHIPPFFLCAPISSHPSLLYKSLTLTYGLSMANIRIHPNRNGAGVYHHMLHLLEICTCPPFNSLLSIALIHDWFTGYECVSFLLCLFMAGLPVMNTSLLPFLCASLVCWE